MEGWEHHLRELGYEGPLPPLSPEDREALVKDLEGLNVGAVARLREIVLSPEEEPDIEAISPPEIFDPASDPQALDRARREGEALLAAGRVAVLLVAGGQATRLGVDIPKGCLPVTPVARKPLFQVFAERIRAIEARYGSPILWFIMTSPSNDREIRSFFAQRRYLGLHPGQVHFMVQANLPILDRKGRPLLAPTGGLAKGPDGHGGTIQALLASGGLDIMRARGVELVFYHQVDNPLVQIADPAYLGYHALAASDMSCKVIEKAEPGEKVGVVVRQHHHQRIIEYSELPDEVRHARDDEGRLAYRAGSIAIHVFGRAFLERLAQEEALPLHVAYKMTPYRNAQGEVVVPRDPNGCKFERFIFDALPLARNPVIFLTTVEEEFAPVKAMRGQGSLGEAIQAQVELHARWLERAGHRVPRDEEGHVKGAVEISPLFALDAAELARKLPSHWAWHDGALLEGD